MIPTRTNGPSISTVYGSDVKALLISSAALLKGTNSTTGVVQNQGFGSVSLFNALEFSDNQDTQTLLYQGTLSAVNNAAHSAVRDGNVGVPSNTVTGAYAEYTVTITDNSRPLVVTLAWTDPVRPGQVKNQLVNDLDLQI